MSPPEIESGVAVDDQEPSKRADLVSFVVTSAGTLIGLFNTDAFSIIRTKTIFADGSSLDAYWEREIRSTVSYLEEYSYESMSVL